MAHVFVFFLLLFFVFFVFVSFLSNFLGLLWRSLPGTVFAALSHVAKLPPQSSKTLMPVGKRVTTTVRRNNHSSRHLGFPMGGTVLSASLVPDDSLSSLQTTKLGAEESWT